LDVGQAVRRDWDAAKWSCRNACENLLDVEKNKERTRQNTGPPHHVVIGTDASKSNGRETGWAFVTSDGRLRSGVIETTDIDRGEFHAVTCAVKCYQYTSCKVLDILTDSWEVYKTINFPEEWLPGRIKQHAVRCLSTINATRADFVTERSNLVRDHNSIILYKIVYRS